MAALIRAAALALLAGPASADTFVLVNGAFTGAHYWAPLVPLLQAGGHEIIAVEFRGQGARLPEGGPEVAVTDHIGDITAAIARAVPPVIFVGHSYGTRPMTGAWDQARDAVAHVVYIEGAAPATDSLTAISGDDDSLAFVVMMYPDVADSGMLQPPPTTDGASSAPMSLRALYGPVEIASPLPPTPGTYVYGGDTTFAGLPRLAAHMADFRSWDVLVLPGGHDVMGNALPDLAAALLDVAAVTD